MKKKASAPKKTAAQKTEKSVTNDVSANKDITVIDHSSGNYLVTEKTKGGGWKQSISEENPLEGDE